MRASDPEVRAIVDEVIELRRRLHRRPELSHQENETRAALDEVLRAAGLQPRECAGGLIVDIEGARPGRTVLWRADMDALPVTERTGLPYASERPGVMHACGHDGHMAIAVGLARLLSGKRDFAGRVRVAWQPAEEVAGGAAPMIEAGLLEGVDRALALHLWSGLPTGAVAAVDGPSFAAVTDFHAAVLGKGGHGALPHLSVDAIVAAAQIVVALQTIVSRTVDPLQAAVVTVGRINGGTKENVIADRVEFSGTLRAFDPALAASLPARVEAMARAVAAAHGCQLEWRLGARCPAVVNDPVVAALAREAVVAALGAEALRELRITGSEDMAHVLHRVPGCYLMIGSADPAQASDRPHHHPEFRLDERALGVGLEVALRAVERALAG